MKNKNFIIVRNKKHPYSFKCCADAFIILFRQFANVDPFNGV